MGKDYSDNSIKNTGERSHFKADVRDIWKVDIGTTRWDFWSVSNQLGRFSMETVISGQWWRSHQSLACKGLWILRLCVMSWKGDSEPNIKYCLGTTVGIVQRFISIDGEPMEFEWNIFPGFTTLQLVDRVQEFMNKMDKPSTIPRTNYLHVDVQWHHMEK